jgi:hypothetical protein
MLPQGSSTIQDLQHLSYKLAGRHVKNAIYLLFQTDESWSRSEVVQERNIIKFPPTKALEYQGIQVVRRCCVIQ